MRKPHTIPIPSRPREYPSLELNDLTMDPEFRDRILRGLRKKLIRPNPSLVTFAYLEARTAILTKALSAEKAGMHGATFDKNPEAYMHRVATTQLLKQLAKEIDAEALCRELSHEPSCWSLDEESDLHQGTRLTAVYDCAWKLFRPTDYYALLLYWTFHWTQEQIAEALGHTHSYWSKRLAWMGSQLRETLTRSAEQPSRLPSSAGKRKPRTYQEQQRPEPNKKRRRVKG